MDSGNVYGNYMTVVSVVDSRVMRVQVYMLQKYFRIGSS